MLAPSRPPVVVIAGPTASGKSRLALEFADGVGGRVINADASQVYADLRVLTARPTPADEVRVPHRLYGLRDGACPVSAALWADWARAEIRDAWTDGRVPVLAGGSGLYLRSLIQGIAPVPPIPDEVRAAVRALTTAEARRALETEDGAVAGRLEPADRQRTLRALEVVRATGRSIAAWQSARTGAVGDIATVHGFVLDVPVADLDRRIGQRFRAMLRAGAAEEVRALTARGLDPGLPVMKAVGVRPIAAWIAGASTRDAAEGAGIIETRQYAKRQRTWFRHQTPGWRRICGGELGVAEQVRRLKEVI